MTKREKGGETETAAAFVIGCLLLAWTFGALTAADNGLVKYLAVVFAGLPGVGLVIYGFRLALSKKREKEPLGTVNERKEIP
ncbi:hypothetical protein [Dehalogenimonas sp. 4OHTPN]|uniref:Uncharacterized protein n=1 Tax=Dehalogenimonas sp. 4OHTPN TaxID=3166643 RepID=A0AAU8GA02_9CHLR